MLSLGSLVGCTITEPLENVVRVGTGEVSFGIPYVQPTYNGASVQSRGTIPYSFSVVYETEGVIIEISNEGKP